MSVSLKVIRKVVIASLSCSFIMDACGENKVQDKAVSVTSSSLHSEVNTSKTSAPPAVIPRTYDSISLGMTTAQVRALFPDFGEDAVNENGPAYMAYKDQNYSGFKTYVADHGSAGFVFIDDCLVGFFIAKPANYEQVLANFRKLYGEPTKFETIADGSEDTTWADGKTQLTVQLKGFEGVFIDAQDYDALVSDFKKHSGHLKQTPKADYVWEIYEGQEYTRGFKSLKAFDEYLAVGNSRALAVRSRMDHGSEVCTINPHTKLKALKYDPNRTLMFAKILDGKRKNQFWWVSKDFIDRL